MLSNKTKLERINFRLKEYGLKLEFACYDLKKYEPILSVYSAFEYAVYKLYGIKMGVKVVDNNIVKFYVKEVHGADCVNKNDDWFLSYKRYVDKIYMLLEHLNNFKLEVPEYKK